MLHSNKILAQQVVQFAIQHGVKNVIISPGSRNAPLIIEWNAYSDIIKYSIVDERSAAFFALGLALEKSEPIALVCTSGSALLNYYPAIAEAYYSDVPLLIISADRPKHLIDIGDGQTIRQENVFQNHIWYNANLTEENSDGNILILKNAFKTFLEKKGPIHINVPFSEPLYETTDSLLSLDFSDLLSTESLIDEVPLSVDLLEKYANIWNCSSKKMVIVGVHRPDEMLQIQLNHLANDPSVIIMTETTSNVFNENFISHIDRLIFPISDDDFEKIKPEILITLGGQVVSKKIKNLLRKFPPLHHWHIDRNWSLNTYHCLTQHFSISPQLFFSQFFFLTQTKESTYRAEYLKLDSNRVQKHLSFFESCPYSDIQVYASINCHFKKDWNLIFSNSAGIRYSQFFNWKEAIFISCNRGTSGIDGSTSTAIGFSTSSKKPTLFVTGDLSFFYDINALWNNYIPSHFRIVLVNNRGGGIFRFISGPTSTQTLDFFETPHQLNAKSICEMHAIEYLSVENDMALEQVWPNFYEQSERPKLMEIFTPRELNDKILKDYFKSL